MRNMAEEMIVEQDLFKEMTVRRFKINNQWVVPIVDIGNSINYDRSDLRRIIENNEDLFTDSQIAVTAFQGGSELKCLTRDGVIALLSSLSTKRIKDPGKRSRIIEFRKWCITTLGKVMDNKTNEIVPFAQQSSQPQPATIADHNQTNWIPEFERQIQAAKFLVEEFGVPKQRAFSTAIFNTTRQTGVNINAFQSILPPITNEDIYVNASMIGKTLDIPAHEVNNFLRNNGYCFKDEKDEWHLTEKGKPYGQKVSQNDYGHEYVFIKWKWDIIEAAQMMKNKPLKIKE